jgi:hypothetical protein
MDLVPTTSKATMDLAPATLPSQALESLCDGFFPDRRFDSIQEAVEIAVKELTPQDQSKFMHGVYELFADIHEVSNAQVAWLSKFEENNAGWRELGYKRYYDYLRTIDSSGWVREMVKQHNTAQKRKERATKQLGDYWQQNPELLEILNEGDGSEKWLRLTALATRTAKDPELAKRCLNYAYVSRIIKLGRKSKVNRWYTSADFKEAKTLVEKGCPVVNEEINLGEMGLKLYRGLVMPNACYPFKEDQSRICTLSPSVPPPNRQIPSASPAQVPSASPALIFPAPPTEEEEPSDLEAPPTPSGPFSLEDPSPEILDTPDTTLDNVTEVTDKDDEATSSDSESDDETAVTPTPVRTKAPLKRKTARRSLTPNTTEDKPAVTPTPVRTKAPLKRKRARRSPTPNPKEDRPIDAIVTCSDYMVRDVRYTHLLGQEERMITYHHGIYGKHAPLIVQMAINREPEVFQIARDQIVSGMIAMRKAVIRAEETLGEASYFINERRKREDEKRKRARKE